jgi:predicted nucleic acid-binding protein
MSKSVIILDSGPLGMVTNPRAKSEESRACQRWFDGIILSRHLIAIPEIADYEIRRELVRTQNFKSIQQLDRLKRTAIYLPITTDIMLEASQLWAIIRQTGQPTAHPQALDGDVILAAQVKRSFPEDVETIVATTNVAHISRFVRADLWQNIG